MKQGIYAISLRPDEAYFTATGRIPIILLNEYYEDMWMVVIHACSYEDPLQRKEAEDRLKQAGYHKDVVKENSLIAFATTDIIEYDDASFKIDAAKHLGGNNLNIFKSENEWGDDPVYGYHLAGLHFLKNPVSEVIPLGADCLHGEVWIAETPFE